MIQRTIRSLLLCATALSLAGSVFAQIIPLGTGKPVKATTMDTRKFYPQINTVKLSHSGETDHELRTTYPFGKANSLSTGGILQEERIVPTGAYFAGIGATGWEPPDPNIGVGPTYIVATVKSSIAFYTKGGTRVFQQQLTDFYNPINPESFVSDPKVFFDPNSKRFFVIDLGITFSSTAPTSSILLAVSATSDPNGNWNMFKVDVSQTEGSNTYWLDYPGLGFTKDIVGMTGNMFAQTGSSGFNGAQIICLDKALLLAGTATPVKFKVTDGFTVQLARTLDSTTSTLYGVETDTQNSMRLTAISKSGQGFSIKQATVSVPAWTQDQGFITGPGGVVVQTNDPRSLTACSMNGRLLSTHTVAASASDKSPAARWYDFNLGNWPTSGSPSLNQSGQLNPPSGFGYSFPAICFDGRQDIAMTFSMIGNTTPGDIMVTGRKPTDPAGAMGLPITLAKSTASQYTGFSTRWGDYFEMALDPTDSKTFWAVGMGAGQSVGGAWQTYINSFKIALADSDLTPIQAQGVTPVAGTLVSGNKASLNAIDSNFYTMQSQSVKGLGQVAGFNAVYVCPFTSIDTLRLFLGLNGPTGSSAIVSIQNVKTGAYDQFLSFGMNSTLQTKTLDLTVDQIAAYVRSNGTISMIIRIVLPTRAGQTPAPFMCTFDKAAFGGARKVTG